MANFASSRSDGRPSIFASSNIVERGFCSACGTPLTYRRIESANISVTIGSLDDPEAARPTRQFGIESELSWIGGLSALPAKRTEDWMRENGIAHIDSRQYSAQLRRAGEGIE
ncbi:MAG TPA: GFA family protein [Xanthobacteraceae bacterium]